MKANKRNITLILVFLLVLGYIVFAYLSEDQYRWIETYQSNDDQPYGAKVIVDLLKHRQDDQAFYMIDQPLPETLSLEADTPVNYVFIGFQPFLDTTSTDHLLKFVEKGHNAFLALKEVPDLLANRLDLLDCEEDWGGLDYEMRPEVSLCFLHPQLQKPSGYRFNYFFKTDQVDHAWNSLDIREVCQEHRSNIIPLGHFYAVDNTQKNFIKIPYGKGVFYIHTTPLVFTNYHLIREEGWAYSNRVFAHLPEGPIYWDQYNKRPSISVGQQIHGMGEGPLKYLLSQRSLRWSWYVLLSFVLLFILFRAKRTQRVIPMVDSNKNSSLDFVTTIGRLYYQHHDHQKLALKKMKHFLTFVREKYQVSTHVPGDELVEKIAERARVAPKTVNKIFKLYNIAKSVHRVDLDLFLRFHQALDHFYKKCK